MNTDAVDLINAVIRDQLRGFKTAELGIVTAVYSHESAGDNNNYECDVRLRDSGLELKRVPVGTQRIGLVAIPNVDDLVLLQFLNGDIHAGLIVSRLHNDKDRPPAAKPREVVYISPDAAEAGIRRLYLEFPNGNKVTLDDDTFRIEMGQSTMTINHNGDVVVDSSNKNITLTDGSGGNLLDIKVSSGSVTVKAQAKVTVDAPQIELASGASHPLVFGDQLLQYLNHIGQIYMSHVHPGEMALGVFPVTPAPPVPPFPPATPALLSVISKTG